ncbi:MAG: permease [Aquificaceae bacterium]
MDEFFVNFYIYVKEMTIPFLIGITVSSFLQVFNAGVFIRKPLKSPYFGPIYAGFIAGALPLCSCSMIPFAYLINSLSRSYAPTMAFLIVAPIVSPLTIFLTYGYFDLKMTAFRLFGTFIFALSFSYFVGLVFKKPPVLPAFYRGQNGKKFYKIFLDNLIGIGKYLVIGVLIAAILKTLIKPEQVLFLSKSSFSYLAMSLISTPVYVCSGEEVPIAKAISEIGFSQGSALSFMLGAAGVCIPTFVGVLKFLPKRLVFTYAVFWVFFSAFMGFLYDVF